MLAANPSFCRDTTAFEYDVGQGVQEGIHS